MNIMQNSAASEVARRRTFAVISHPDAGKTTLTEKLLLFGGAIQLAGQVRAKRNRISTRSDWMAIERSARHLGRHLGDDLRRWKAMSSTCSTRPATRTSPRTPTAR
jgi:hypothetical protein